MHVPFYRHQLGPECASRIAQVLAGPILTTGNYVQEAEATFATFLGLQHAVALDSCTAALHLALLAAGIGPGDEVITTPLTFVATANAIFMAGGRPVFVDVEPDTGNLDASLVEAAVTSHTKAILPVHLYGAMCDMRMLRDLADRYDLALIEDAAHCLEGSRDGYSPGELGDSACFSFYATKNVTCGEGGMLASNNAELVARVRRLSCHGIDRNAYDRYGKAYQHWDMLELGWKYNLDNLRASLLLPQIPQIKEKRERREVLCKRYEEVLARLSLAAPVVPPNSVSARHLQTVWVDATQRDAVLSALQQRGIGVAVNYRALPELNFFRAQGFREDDTPVAASIGKRTLSLPLYPGLRDEEQNAVIAALREVVKSF